MKRIDWQILWYLLPALFVLGFYFLVIDQRTALIDLETVWLGLMLGGGMLVSMARTSSIFSEQRPKLFGMTMGEWGALLIVLGVGVVMLEFIFTEVP